MRGSKIRGTLLGRGLSYFGVYVGDGECIASLRGSTTPLLLSSEFASQGQ